MNFVSVMRITKASEVRLISVTNRIRFWGKQLKWETTNLLSVWVMQSPLCLCIY